MKLTGSGGAASVRVEASAKHHERRVLLGRWGAPFILFCALSILGAFVFAWGWISNDAPTPVFDMLVNALLPCQIMILVLSLSASVRIVGSTGGYIEVVNLLVKRRIPFDDIVGMSSDGPLKIRRKSGRAIGSFAYGESLIGETFGYPRSRRTAARIQNFCDKVTMEGGNGGTTAYSVELRVGALGASLLLGAFMAIVTIILHHLR